MNLRKNDGPAYRADRATVLEALEARLALSGMETVLPVAMPEGAMLASGQSPALLIPAESDTAPDLAVRGPGGGGGGKGGGGSGGGGGGGNKPPMEAAGNNLSYPVIWSDGVQKTLQGTPGMQPILSGEWWYQWGTDGVDPNVVPVSFPPDPDATNTDLNPDGLPLYDDGIPGTVDLTLVAGENPLAEHPLPLAKAFVQKDPLNVWQADTINMLDPSGDFVAPVNVDLVDWGDNLESVDWTIRSQVRTEVVLYEDAVAGDVEDHLIEPLLEYEMRHVSGWGITEVHGLATTVDDALMLGPGTRTTVYSHAARMTIQKLNVPRETIEPETLVWIPEEGWTESGSVPSEVDLINPPIFNSAVRDAADGPGDFSAEINVKGKVIYGYTWNVRNLNQGAGDYRLTFSLDASYADLNTFFEEGITEIIVPEEEEESSVVITGESPDVGATAQLDCSDNQLTYIDIRIVEKGGGGGGGGKPDRVKKPKVKPITASVAAAALATTDPIGEQDRLMVRAVDQDQLKTQDQLIDQVRLSRPVILGECEPIADQLTLLLRDQDRLLDFVDDTPTALADVPVALAVDQAFAADAELLAVFV